MAGEHDGADSEHVFEALFESAPDAMVIVGGDGNVRLMNAQAEQLFGYARGELVGKSVELLVPERSRAAHAQHRERFLRGPSVRGMAGRELVGRRRDGSEFPIEVRLSPIETPEGVWVSSAIRDLSERRSEAEPQPLDGHPDSARSLSAAPPTARVPSRARILLIDDETLILRSWTRALGRSFEVVANASATEALTLLRSGESFDVILCDLMMPMVSGVELYHVLAAERPELLDRMLFLSGGALTGEAAAFTASRGERFLNKPLSIAALEAAVAGVLRQRSAAER